MATLERERDEDKLIMYTDMLDDIRSIEKELSLYV